jgi:4-amino-4-deoxy-L-arabinose transferase-like glycosyltransferase
MNALRRWQPPALSLRKTSGHERKLGRGAVLWFFVGVLIYCSIGNVIWLSSHWLTLPPPWDQSFYLYMGLRYLHALGDYGRFTAFREFVHLSTDVAPLYPLTTVPLYILFGHSRLVAYLTNIVYLGLLLGGIYLLGAHLYGRSAGLLAAFVAATFTATVNYSRDYLLEFPATAFVTLGMYALLRSETFRRRPWCVAFGALVGCSVLTKTMTGVFFIGPVLFVLVCVVWQHRLNAAVLRNFLLAVVVGILVAAVWWGPNFRTAFRYLVYYGFQAGSVPYSEGVAGILSLENLSYYALHLMNHGLSFLYALLFAGLIIFVGSKACLGADRPNLEDIAIGPTAASQANYLWVWLLSGYLILTLVPNKGEERYALPLLPAMALLLSGGIEAIGRRWVRRGMIALTLVVGGFNYLGLTYDLPSIPQRLYISRLALISREYPHYSWVRNKTPASQDYHWPISAILSLLTELTNQHKLKAVADLRTIFRDRGEEMSIEEEIRMVYRAMLQREPGKRALQKDVAALKAGSLSRDALIDILIASPEFKNRRAKVLVIPDHPQFNASTLRYYAEVDRVPLSFSHILEGPITTQRLQEYDFILVKDAGYQGPEFSTRYTDQIHERLLQPGSGFVHLPERFPFPDHSYIGIFVALPLVN